MPSMFEQSMSRCDDCDGKKPLRWFGPHIRICDDCRDDRLARAQCNGTLATMGDQNDD